MLLNLLKCPQQCSSSGSTPAFLPPSPASPTLEESPRDLQPGEKRAVAARPGLTP